MQVRVLRNDKRYGQVGELRGDSVHGKEFAVVKFPDSPFVFVFKKTELEVVGTEEKDEAL